MRAPANMHVHLGQILQAGQYTSSMPCLFLFYSILILLLFKQKSKICTSSNKPGAHWKIMKQKKVNGFLFILWWYVVSVKTLHYVQSKSVSLTMCSHINQIYIVLPHFYDSTTVVAPWVHAYLFFICANNLLGIIIIFQSVISQFTNVLSHQCYFNQQTYDFSLFGP